MENRKSIKFGLALFSLSIFLSSCETGVPPKEVAQVYYNLGNAYFELEKYSLAVSAYLNALALDNTLPQAGYNLARVYIESKDYEKGLAALAELLEQDPGNSLVLSTIGWTYYLSADYEKALETFDQILQRTPTDERGLYNAAVLSLKLDRKEAALGYFRRLYSKTEEAETLYRIASLYMDLRRWEDAIDALNEYLAKNPKDTAAHYDLGIAYTAERHYGKALSMFQTGIELGADDPFFHFEKAVILLLYIENVDEGLKALKAAVEAGFKDTDRISALLNAEELLFKDEVKRFFEEKNLLPEEPAAGLKPADETEVDGREEELPAEEGRLDRVIEEVRPAEESPPENETPEKE